MQCEVPPDFFALFLFSPCNTLMAVTSCACLPVRVSVRLSMSQIPTCLATCRDVSRASPARACMCVCVWGGGEKERERGVSVCV